jgi:hypothetical protein
MIKDRRKAERGTEPEKSLNQDDLNIYTWI